MDSKITERLKDLNNNLWTPLPAIKHGIKIVIVNTGSITTSSTGGKRQSFAVHRNLLLASSAYFQTVLNGESQGSNSSTIELPEDIPETFQVFYDFLYTGIASEQDANGFYETDHFWLLVYMMADRLAIYSLKPIAYHRFKACFKPTESKILPQSRKILPSHNLTTELFESDSAPMLFRAWVVDHVLWYHFCSTEVEGMSALVNKFPALAAEIGRAVINEKRNLDGNRRHPSYDTAFAKKHGLDGREIKAKARSAAELLTFAGSKITLKRRRTEKE